MVFCSDWLDLVPDSFLFFLPFFSFVDKNSHDFVRDHPYIMKGHRGGWVVQKNGNLSLTLCNENVLAVRVRVCGSKRPQNILT